VILEIKNLFKSDIEEIELYKTNPTLFQSIYYIAMTKIEITPHNTGHKAKGVLE